MNKFFWIVLGLFALTHSVSAQCLSYEPKVQSLSGVILRRTFPGPPSYSSIKAGDEAERYWILRLTKPICVDAADEPNIAEKSQKELQLVLDEIQYKEYRDLLGKNVTVTGTIFHSHTGHHHKKLLFTVSSILNKK